MTLDQLRNLMLRPGAVVRRVAPDHREPSAYPMKQEDAVMPMIKLCYPRITVEKAVDMYNSVQLMAPTTRLLDIHTITAAMIHHVPYSEVTKEQRQQAKSMNYFWLYQPGTFYEPPERYKLFSIYTPAEIKQLQVDLKWDGSEDLYESIKRFFQPVK